MAPLDGVGGCQLAPAMVAFPKPAYVHTFSLWRLAEDSVSSGLRARNQKLALVEPHMRYVACGSVTHGIRWTSTLFSGLVLQKALNERFVADGNPKNLQALLCCP